MSAILHVFSGYLLCCVLSTIISVIMTRHILFLKKFYCIRFLKWTWWNLARFVYEMHEYRVDSVMAKNEKTNGEGVLFILNWLLTFSFYSLYTTSSRIWIVTYCCRGNSENSLRNNWVPFIIPLKPRRSRRTMRKAGPDVQHYIPRFFSSIIGYPACYIIRI